jgi:hypothetical protein
VEEIRAIDELRAKVLTDIGQLRQHELDLQAAETKVGLYTKESPWLQQRVKAGFEDTPALWTLGHKLTDERAAVERLRGLVAAKRYQLAHYAGERWGVLLGYLEGKGKLAEEGER